MRAEPGEDVGGVAVGWEHGVEGFHDHAVFGDEGEALVDGHVLAADLDLEGGEAKRGGEAESWIGEQRIVDVLAGGELGLFRLALGADPDQASGGEPLEGGEAVTVGAALRGAAAGAGDVVPAPGSGLPGTPVRG